MDFHRSGLMALGGGVMPAGLVAQPSPCLSGMERSHKVGSRWSHSAQSACLAPGGETRFLESQFASDEESTRHGTW